MTIIIFSFFLFLIILLSIQLDPANLKIECSSKETGLSIIESKSSFRFLLINLNEGSLFYKKSGHSNFGFINLKSLL